MKISAVLIGFGVLACFSSCAGSRISPTGPEYFTADSPELVKLTDVKLTEELTRHALITGFADIKVYPITDGLIQKRGKDVAAQKKLYTEKKTCFSISLATMGGKDNAKPENWSALLEDAVGKTYPLAFSNPDPASSEPHNGFPEGIWASSTYGCTDQRFDLTQRVKFILTPPADTKRAPIVFGWFKE